MKFPSYYDADAILILDDEFDIMNVFMLGLEKDGFHVFGFTEPLLALEHFQKNSEQYGLVISDLRMPVMNGYQFIEKVKKLKPEVKIFCMSAFEIDYTQFRIELPFIDIDEFIQKPIRLEDFVMTVKKTFSDQRST
jgi:DNA-binding NtrC family response regulator